MARPLVLVVEDERTLREPLEKFLTVHGFHVHGEAEANGAVAWLAGHRPDAAVVDLRLPGGTGRDVVRAIAQPTPVIIFSGVPNESDHLEIRRPYTRLVLKPFSLTMIAEMLRKMLAAQESRASQVR
jgi:two-component system OmpR family response regulator